MGEKENKQNKQTQENQKPNNTWFWIGGLRSAENK